jgi:hypothetical protein
MMAEYVDGEVSQLVEGFTNRDLQEALDRAAATADSCAAVKETAVRLYEHLAGVQIARSAWVSFSESAEVPR